MMLQSQIAEEIFRETQNIRPGSLRELAAVAASVYLASGRNPSLEEMKSLLVGLVRRDRVRHLPSGRV